MHIPISKILLDQEEEREVVNVLRSGWVMQGPQVQAFEEEIAAYIGSRYAVAVSSGTAALHLALLALGIKKDDEVIVPSFSFVATANCILYVGATPVFADIDKKTFNIDPHDIEKKITQKTKAIIVVHQIGLSAAMDEIKQLCKRYELLLIEDAACALGAIFKGKKVGSFGDVGCFSFHPRKSITTGEGGIITTNSAKVASMIQSLRSHGAKTKNGKDYYEYLGYNFRLTDIQAAIGLMQFRKLEKILEKRDIHASFYNEAFKNIRSITIPYVPPLLKHTYQSYMITIQHPAISRDMLARALEKKGIATKKGITLIHKEPLYQKLIGDISLPKSENVGRNSLILPFYTQITKQEQAYIVRTVKSILKE